MAKNEGFFEKFETKKALFLSFLIALVLIGIEAIRKFIELIVNLAFYGATIESVIESYGYVVGLLIAVLILFYFTHKYSDVIKK